MQVNNWLRLMCVLVSVWLVDRRCFQLCRFRVQLCFVSCMLAFIFGSCDWLVWFSSLYLFLFLLWFLLLALSTGTQCTCPNGTPPVGLCHTPVHKLMHSPMLLILEIFPRSETSVLVLYPPVCLLTSPLMQTPP